VLARPEAQRLLVALPGTHQLIGQLLYGTGLRLQDVATTQIYTHVMQKPGLGVRSPLDL